MNNNWEWERKDNDEGDDNDSVSMNDWEWDDNDPPSVNVNNCELASSSRPLPIMDNWDSDDHFQLFKNFYRCYSLSRVDKVHLESGNKIIMPQSAFHRLECTDHIVYPLQFELCNLCSGRTTHCGVLEFTAEEGFIYIPDWMMETMKIQEYDTVSLENSSLKKATHMKLRPHTEDFLKISDPKAVLETALRNFSCVTTGDTIMIMHQNQKLYIDILETKPSSAVCMIDTDCEVDFAPPLDYKEPAKPVKKAVKPPQVQQKQQPVVEEEYKVKVVQPFSGKARRLNGMPYKQVSATTSDSSSLQKEKQYLLAAKDTNNNAESERRKAAGKLVFGSNMIKSPTGVAEPSSKADIKEEETAEVLEKFQAFTGRSFRLSRRLS